jgi:hypothetical protein
MLGRWLNGELERNLKGRICGLAEVWFWNFSGGDDENHAKP